MVCIYHLLFRNLKIFLLPKRIHCIFSFICFCSINVDMVCIKLPSPLEMTDVRAEKLMCSKTKTFDSLAEKTQHLKKAFLACDSTEDAPVIVFISKMTMVNFTSCVFDWILNS